MHLVFGYTCWVVLGRGGSKVLKDPVFHNMFTFILIIHDFFHYCWTTPSIFYSPHNNVYGQENVLFGDIYLYINLWRLLKIEGVLKNKSGKNMDIKDKCKNIMKYILVFKTSNNKEKKETKKTLSYDFWKYVGAKTLPGKLSR